MNRRRADLQQLDADGWPSVDYNTLTGSVRKTFQRRQRAVELYLKGESVRDIVRQTQVECRQLYRLLRRCVAIHRDGRPFGFRALVPHQRVRDYTRVKHPKALPVGGSRGTAGAFEHLLERYPALLTWLQQQLRDRRVFIQQLSTDNNLRLRLRGLSAVHSQFLQECRKVGITAADYPLSADKMGKGALRAMLKSEILRTFGTTARAAGAKRLKGLPRTADDATAPAAARALEVVEFDGHRLDLRLKIVVQDPLGFEQSFEIERVWLLVILDVATRAVLGYHLCLEREYSRYDVIRTIEKALEPHRLLPLNLPGLSYYQGGGFPSVDLPELGYATWQWLKLDRAKANLADDTLHALCEFVGCFVDVGPAHSPDERPYIERFFGTLASTLSSRLPGYTGSNPQDLRRALSDPKSNLRLILSLSELEQVLEVALARYNGTPHNGLNSRTPLEAMHLFVRGRGELLQWLPELKRRTLCLMQTPTLMRVRGYLSQGRRGHVNFHGVRYTNDVLAASAVFLGKQLRCYYNNQDLRTVRAFLPDGTEIGLLKAQGMWGEIVHDLKLRKEIMKLRGKKRFAHALSEQFLEQWIEDKRKQAKSSRRAASQLAQKIRTLAEAPTSNALLTLAPPTSLPLADITKRAALTDDVALRFAGGEVDAAAPIATVTALVPPPKRTRKIKPQPLSIGTGYAD
jgi:putative transposase